MLKLLEMIYRLIPEYFEITPFDRKSNAPTDCTDDYSQGFWKWSLLSLQATSPNLQLSICVVALWWFLSLCEFNVSSVQTWVHSCHYCKLTSQLAVIGIFVIYINLWLSRYKYCGYMLPVKVAPSGLGWMMV